MKPRPTLAVSTRVLLRTVTRLQREKRHLELQNMALRDPNTFHWAVSHVSLMLNALQAGPILPGAADTSAL